MRIEKRSTWMGAVKHVLAMCMTLSALPSLAQEVIPDFYRDPGISPNRSFLNQSFNEHIDPFTGSLQLHYVDLHLPGNGGFDLSVIRSYNSSLIDPTSPAVHDSQAGLGWNIHFGRALKSKEATICSNMNALSVADNPTLEMPDGGRQLLAFTGVSSPLMLTTQRWRADCSSNFDGLAVYSPDGTRYDMTHLVNVGSGVQPVFAWYTSKITDRNGNYATVQYAGSASPEISSVTTNDGRSLSFTYDDAGLLSRRIRSITGEGRTYHYDYQAVAGVSGTYFLSTVTRPDGLSWGYTYYGNLNANPGSYVIDTVRYPQGGTIDYGYGFVYFDGQANPMSRSTVVTSKSLSTGGNWSFSYAPGSFNSYDVTTVTTPAGPVVYRHIGPNYAGSGTLWQVGLLVSKSTGTVQTETYEWVKQKISNENYFRPGAFVLKVDMGETNAANLSKKTIVRDGASYVTSYSAFDNYGNPGTVTEAGPNGGNRTTTRTYFTNPANWIVNRLKDESYSGSSTSRSFDANGNLLSVTEDGVTTSYTYDGQGNIASATFPRSLKHTYTNYKRGIAQTETQPEGVSITRVVSDTGNVTSETNGDQITTSYGYDDLNRLTSITMPVGSPVTISYAQGSKTSTRGSLTETTTFDGFGRVVGMDHGGITRTYQVNALGQVTFASDPDTSNGTSFDYDALGRLKAARYVDGNSTITSYGAGTRTVRDARLKDTKFTLRAYGDPDQVLVMAVDTAEASASLTIGRNSKGKMTSVTQAGLTRTYGYNSNYYLTSVINPETGTTIYGRDAAGNMTSRKVGASGDTIYAYDQQNRLSSITYPGTTPAVTRSYNKRNLPLTVNSSAANRGFTYDNNGNLKTDTLVVDGRTLAASYAYNGNDYLTGITYPVSNRTVTYTPDALGRTTGVSGYISDVSYWPSGQTRRIAYANGTVTNYDQNYRLWPRTFSTERNGALYGSSTYSYDGNGNLTGIVDGVDASYNRDLVYDNIERLTNAKGPWGSGTIAYDGTGNIKTQTMGASSLSYNYDSANRLSSLSGSRSATYSYDVYGDVVAAANNAYTYDAVPNLVCVNCAQQNKIEYKYDGNNQRVMVTRAGIKSYEMHNAQHNQLVEYSPSEANKLIEYIYLNGKRIAQRVTNTRVASATVLAATPAAPAVGQSVTLTATVSGNAPGGNVVFKDGTAVLGTASISAGNATLATSFALPGAHALTANYAGDVNNIASSGPLALTVSGRAIPTLTVGATPNPVGFNQPVVVTVTITGSKPSGTIALKDGLNALGTATILAGKASFNISLASLGGHTLVASYVGDANNTAATSAGYTVTVNSKTTSQIVLSANPASAGINQLVTLTAIVTGSNPSGLVTFTDGAVVLGTASVTAGKATLSKTFSSTGVHSLGASYPGDAANTASSAAALNFTVNLLATSGTTLVATPSPAVLNVAVTLTATVTGNAPAGTVTFRDGAAVIGSASISAGVAVLKTYAFTSTGAHSLSATYEGDQNNAASNSASYVLTVMQQAISSTTLSATPNPGVLNQQATLTATVSGSSPTGTVTFKDGTAILGTASVSGGRATLSTVFTVANMHALSASYGGNVSNTASTSAVLNLAVNSQQVSSVTLAAAPTVVAVNKNAALTATVVGSKPTGLVTFLDGTTVLGQVSLDANGKAVLAKAFAVAGVHSLSASYAGDTYNTAKTSAAIPLTVVQPVATTVNWEPLTTASTGPNPVLVGNTTYLRVYLTGGTGAYGPTGMVTFKDAGAVIGSVPVAAYNSAYNKYWALLAINTLSQGTHSITAEYAGDVANLAAVSPPMIQTVNGKTATSVNWRVAFEPPAIVAPGQPFNVQAIVTGSAPTGTIVFKDGSTVLSTQTLISGSDPRVGATLTLNTAGAHTITMEYSGDASNLPSSSNTAITVQAKTAASVIWREGFGPPATIVAGQPFSVQAIVSGTSPTGTIVFKDGTTVLSTQTLFSGTDPRVGATLTLNTAGARTITMEYSGDVSNLPATSNTPITVNAKTATSVIWRDGFGPPASIVAGQPFSVQAIVTGTSPTGTIVFKDGATVLSTQTLISGSDPRVGATLTLNTAGARTITMEYSGDVSNLPATSNTAITVNAKTAASVIWRDGFGPPAAIVAGQPFSVQAMVTGTSPTGTIVFKDGATVLTTQTLISGSDPRVAATLTLNTAGARTITMEYSGDVSNLPATSNTAITVNAKTAASVIWRDGFGPPATIVAGQPFSVQAIVTGTSPTGTIVFKDGTTILSTQTLFSGTDPRVGATLTLNTAGARTITMEYSGDVSNLPATSNTAITVNAKTAASVIWRDGFGPPATIVAGQPFSVQAMVTGTRPTGTIVFKDGATVLSTQTLFSGTDPRVAATLTLNTAGPRTITMEYSGDVSNLPATSNTAITVNAKTAASVIWRDGFGPPATIVAGKPFSVQAMVTGTSPTGTIVFKDGATVLSTQTLFSGTDPRVAATLTLNTTGVRTITMEYSGDVSNLPASSNTPITVQPKTAASVIWRDGFGPPATIVAGKPFSVQAMVVGTSPTGTIVFKDGATVLSTQTLFSGTDPRVAATLTLDTAGARTITMEYSGDASNAPATSNTPITVTPKTAATVGWRDFFGPPAAITVGQSFNVQAVVSGTSPTGTIVFKDGATVLSTQTLFSGTDPRVGATLVMNTAGARTITMEYSGDASNLPATSVTNITVNPKATTTVYWRDFFGPPASVTRGQAFNVQAMVSGALPTGTIRFRDGDVVITTTSLISGSDPRTGATLVLSTPGSRVITMEYSGDASNLPATRDTVITVN